MSKSLTKSKIRRKLIAVLKKQGYRVNRRSFSIDADDREAKRRVHSLAKQERLKDKKDFIVKNIPVIKQYLIDGTSLDVTKIEPTLIEVVEGSKWATIFRWWNLVWWSLPYEHAYGRQIRYVVWDRYHKAPIGLIGLQSPILSWSVRDNYLNIPWDSRDFWVNQSLNAQRLGALPPYNQVLGGKLISYLVSTDVVRNKFKKKYTGVKTLIKQRKLPARLLFITTTGAYGKSSVYTRLKYKEQYVAKFIGYSHGSGSFHIPNTLFEKLVKFLKPKGYDVRRGFGSGPSRKLRLISQSLQALGFQNGSDHGIKRAVYLFPFAKNLNDVIQKKARPKWNHYTIKELTNYWKVRWAIPKIQKDISYREFNGNSFVEETLKSIGSPKMNHKREKD